MCDIVMKQLSYQRSNRALGFPAVFGLFLWSSGCSRKTIEALHQCGLSVSYSSVLNNIASLANHCMQLAVQIGSGIHVFCYDNVNLSTSVFVEQRGSSGPAKVTSGTLGIIYKVRNGIPENMLLGPIIERFKHTKGLEFKEDIRPTFEQTLAFISQIKIYLVDVLLKYSSEFKFYKKGCKLNHNTRRRIPSGYRTEQYPIRITTIEEASTRGNLLFHDDVYITQLKQTHEQLSKYAIPSINDQLTNSRIRSAQILRARDSNPWTRREVFQLGIGLFHLCLNLVWALLHIHRGTLEQTGSLTYFFSVLQKTRLGSEHPDYHALLSTLMQILDGLLLNAWRNECGFATLAEFARSKPSNDTLLNLAEKIVKGYAIPLATIDEDSDDQSGSDTEGDVEAALGSHSINTAQRPRRTSMELDPDKDRMHQNLRLLTRDLLYVAELVDAVSDGDFGRIEDFLPQLAMLFRGAGSNNYCTEILHFIFNLKHVWTPQFA